MSMIHNNYHNSLSLQYKWGTLEAYIGLYLVYLVYYIFLIMTKIFPEQAALASAGSGMIILV